jgi:ribosome-associated protein
MSKADSKRDAPAASIPEEVQQAARAALDKKAIELIVLDLREVAGFTDYFVICSGQSPRQVRAIADAVEEALRQRGARPAHIEGYERSDWVLLDYFDFIVHVFNPQTRLFYGLERLWGSAARVEVPDTPPRA